MTLDKLNGVTYFYYGDVEKVLINSDINLFLNNFDQVSLELIKYLDEYGCTFNKNDPKAHYNLILNLGNDYLNYYYSFPFSHKSNLKYYEYLSRSDLFNVLLNQHWRPYIGVHDKNLLNLNKIHKFNLNPNNYFVNNDFKSKVYNILKMYKNK